MKTNNQFGLMAALWGLGMLFAGQAHALQTGQTYQQCLSSCSSSASISSSQNPSGPSFQQLYDSCVASSCSNDAAAVETQHQVEDQQARQVTRQISNLISNRISAMVNPGYYTSNNNSPKPGAGDSHSMMPDSVWSTFAWSRLDNNNNSNGRYDVDIFQTTTGVDKNIGNFYFGATLDYAGTSANLRSVGTSGSNHTVGLTPYAAYKFTDQFFVSALTGYHFSATNFDTVLPDTDSDTYVSELDLNALHVIDHWFMKGKAGARYLHLDTRSGAFGGGSPTTQTNQDIWTILTDAELGYAFDNGVRAYNSILFEHLDAAQGTVLNGITYRGNNIFYYSVGADYAVSKKFTLGTRFQTDLNNNAVNLSTLSLNARLLLE